MIALVLGGAFSAGGVLLINELLGLRRPKLVSRVLPQNRPVRVPLMTKFNLGLKRHSVSKKRLRAALFELPEILELMAVSLTAGDGLFVSLARVAPKARGVLARELQAVLIALELGSDLEVELRALVKELPQRQVMEFANKLALSLRRGSPLATLLREQSASARAEIRNDLLRQAGRNETRMLIPLVFLILPVTVLFAIFPSLQLLNLNYL